MALGLFALAGCSSGSGPSGAPACDSSKCATGNQCIDDGSGSGPTCHKVCTQQSQCPFGWYCNDGQLAGQPASWCVQSTTALTPTTGQWGTPCPPTGGETGNSACDTADSFACYGQSPTDANAFCTIFGCQQDSDCPGGWWCETVDKQPSVKSATRSFGPVRTVCTPRQYCSTCQMDHDCPAAADGTQQHCVQDTQGNGFCTPQCGSAANCALDAKCVTQWSVCTPAQGATCQSDDDCPPADGTFQHCDAGACTPECASSSDCTGNGQKCATLATCQPRAGVCVGTGDFCSPCHADSDCTPGGGYCVYADYSTERYCSVPMSSGTCPKSTQAGVEINEPPAGTCPKAPAGSSASVAGRGAVGCTIVKSVAPANECVALTSISDGNGGEAAIVGCWTINR